MADQENILFTEIVNTLKSISSRLSSSDLAISDWIQIVAVLAAIFIPLVVICWEEKKRKRELAEQKELELEKLLNHEKEILIALYCLLTGNLNALLGYKKQHLLSLSGDVEWVKNELNAMASPDKANNPDYGAWLDNLANNDSISNICNGHLYPHLTGVSILLDKINFLSKKIPNTFVLIHTVNALSLQYHKISTLRNNEVSLGRKINNPNYG